MGDLLVTCFLCSLALGAGEKKFSNPNAVLKATGFGGLKDVQEGSGAAVYKTTSQVARDVANVLLAPSRPHHQ
jgi:hypothetical protein